MKQMNVLATKCRNFYIEVVGTTVLEKLSSKRQYNHDEETEIVLTFLGR
jgi:hypothetical protein